MPDRPPVRTTTRILHILGPLPERGVLASLFALLGTFDRESYEVQLAAQLPEPDIALARAFSRKFHSLPSLRCQRRPWRRWHALVEIQRVLRAQPFDLVHTWTPLAGYWGRLAAKRCRIPVIVHTYLDLPLPPGAPPWKRALLIARERRLRSATDYWILSTENVREQARQHRLLDEHRCQVLYPGIDYAPLNQRADTTALRRELAVPESWAVVLTAGPLDRQRAPELLAETMRELVLTHPRTLLLIVGTGPRRARLQEHITRLNLGNHVRLLGGCLQMTPLIKAADVFVTSSPWEDLGQPLRMAMLLGKPVVAPERSGISELVQHSETGLLYEPGKAHQLASHLRYLLDHPAERYRLGVNARRWTRPRFEVNAAARQLEQIYDQLLRAKLPRRMVPLPIPATASSRAA
jgi:glycosyltransferase involved in cell wall biosynthesis